MTEETKEKPKASGHKKGLAYERQFEAFMVESLGFNHVEHRTLIKGANVDRPFEADLFGRKKSTAWAAVAYVSTLLVVLLIAVFLIAKLGGEQTNAHDWSARLDTYLVTVEPRLQGYGLAVLAVLVYVFIIIGMLKTRIHVWVECRDRKGKVNRNYVFEVRGRRDAAKKYSDVDELWIVSSSGFDSDALSEARANKVHCIVFRDSKATIVNDLPSRVAGL